MNKDQLKLLITPDYSDLEVRVMGYLLESGHAVMRASGEGDHLTFDILAADPDTSRRFNLALAPRDPEPLRPNQPWYRQFDKRRT